MESDIFTIESVILRILESFAQFMLVAVLLNNKVKIKKVFLYSTIFAIVYDLIRLITPYHSWWILSIMIAIPMLYLLLKNSLIQIVSSYLITGIIVSIVDCISVYLILVSFNLSNASEITQGTIPYIVGHCLLTAMVLVIAIFIYYHHLDKFDLRNMKKMKGTGILLNVITTFLILIPNIIVLIYHHENETLPFGIVLINICSIIILFFVSTYNVQRSIYSAKIEQDLIAQQNYSKTQQDLIDGLRTFKHDYSNTLQTMNSCLQYNKIDKLKEIFQQVMDETKVITTLDSLNPNKIKDPAVFGILNGKYKKAKENKVKMEVEVLGDTEGIDIEAYDLTRILGILLDNAIEAAKESKKKKVTFSLTERRNDVVFEITNTFSEKEINLEKIKEKGVSSKGKNRGLGLYKVEEIVNKYDSVENTTQIEGDTFIQILNISKTGVLVKN